MESNYLAAYPFSFFALKRTAGVSCGPFAYRLLFTLGPLLGEAQPGDGGGDALDGALGGVDAEIVVDAVAPLLPGAILIVFGPAAVDGVDTALQLPVGQVLLLVALLPAAAHLAGHIRVHEDAEGFLLLQDVVRAAAHDDAVRLGRHLPQDAALLPVDVAALLQMGVGHQPEAASDMDGKGGDGPVPDDLLYILLGQLRALGDLLDDLLVVVGAAQVLRQAASQLSAAAPELPADGNDLVHPVSSFFLRSVLPVVVSLLYRFRPPVASVFVQKD